MESYTAFTDADLLRGIVARMLAGISTPATVVALESVAAAVEQAAASTSESGA